MGRDHLTYLVSRPCRAPSPKPHRASGEASIRANRERFVRMDVRDSRFEHSILHVPKDDLRHICQTDARNNTYQSTAFGLGLVISKLASKTHDTAALQAEAQNLMRCSHHPNIVSLFGIVETLDNFDGFLMEYMNGGFLSRVIHTGIGEEMVKYDEVDYLHWTAQACRALAFCHANSIIHRDVKPENMLLSADRSRLKLGDFSSAVHIIEDKELPLVGTLCYMAPELIKPLSEEKKTAKYDSRCDVYSMAISLWEMATRKKPFEFDGPEIIQNQVLIGRRPNIDTTWSSSDVAKIITRHWTEIAEYAEIIPETIGSECTSTEDIMQGVEQFHQEKIGNKRPYMKDFLRSVEACLYRLEKNDAEQLKQQQEQQQNTGDVEQTGAIVDSTSPAEKLMVYHQIDEELLTNRVDISTGSFGQVYKVVAPSYGTVAFKMYEPNNSRFTSERRKEIISILMKCNHPNVLQFFSFVRSKTDISGVLMEYMVGGSLDNVIHAPEGSSRVNYEEAHYLSWAVQACRGLSFCHFNGLIHRNVKPCCFLLSADKTILKIGNFMLARENTTEKMTACVGTWRYMAPEMMGDSVDNYAVYNEHCDVYSMAISLWEMATRTVPYQYTNPANLQREVQNGVRPAFTKDHVITEDVAAIIKEHWQPITERPDMHHMLAALEKVCESRVMKDKTMAPENETKFSNPVPTDPHLQASKAEECRAEFSNVNAKKKMFEHDPSRSIQAGSQNSSTQHVSRGANWLLNTKNTMKSLLRPSTDEMAPSVAERDLTMHIQIGHGRYGDVFKVFQSTFGTVVYKRNNEHKLSSNQMKEACMQLKLCFHINTLLFHAFVRNRENVVGLLFEYMPGGSLRELIHPQSEAVRIPYFEENYLSWAVQACRGLAFCHENKFLHRDVKPGNLLLSADGTRLKVGDFGLAREGAKRMTSNVGTWLYMAPEVMSECGDVDMKSKNVYDERCDVYSMAVTLWEMVSKRTPYAGAYRNVMNFQAAVMNGVRPYMSESDYDNYVAKMKTDNPSFKPVFDVRCFAAPTQNPVEDDILEIIRTHWSDSSVRPTMVHMRDELDSVCRQRALHNIKLKPGNEHMLILPITRTDQRKSFRSCVPTS